MVYRGERLHHPGRLICRLGDVLGAMLWERFSDRLGGRIRSKLHHKFRKLRENGLQR